MKKLALTAAALAASSMQSVALAHIPDIEPQAMCAIPAFAPASADYSFSFPYDLGDVADSRSISAYLTWGDVDYYKFEVTAADVAMGPKIVSAQALAPACFEYQNVYPTLALIGPQRPGPFGPPGLPAPTSDMHLPFTVPAGMGVIAKTNPPIYYPEKRPIFSVEEEGLSLSFFLPKGLTDECLRTNPTACDFTNTIAQPVFYPGTYYIVMWNPAMIPTDYIASVGFSEAHYDPDPEILEKLKEGVLHRTCHTPYPFR